MDFGSATCCATILLHVIPLGYFPCHYLIPCLSTVLVVGYGWMVGLRMDVILVRVHTAHFFFLHTHHCCLTTAYLYCRCCACRYAATAPSRPTFLPAYAFFHIPQPASLPTTLPAMPPALPTVRHTAYHRLADTRDIRALATFVDIYRLHRVAHRRGTLRLFSCVFLTFTCATC